MHRIMDDIETVPDWVAEGIERLEEYLGKVAEFERLHPDGPRD